METIARQLKVSKGSFYWHFRDVGAPKIAMLNHWAQLATHGTIEKIEHVVDDGRVRLLALIALASGTNDEEYGGTAVEGAIRGWARVDGGVLSVVREIEVARLSFVASLFEMEGVERKISEQNARLFYGAMIGLEQLPGSDRKRTGKELEELLEILPGNARTR